MYSIEMSCPLCKIDQRSQIHAPLLSGNSTDKGVGSFTRVWPCSRMNSNENCLKTRYQ